MSVVLCIFSCDPERVVMKWILERELYFSRGVTYTFGDAFWGLLSPSPDTKDWVNGKSESL